MEQGRFLCPPTNVVAVMGMMQDCAQHMADRVDLHLGGGGTLGPSGVWGCGAGEKTWGEEMGHQRAPHLVSLHSVSSQATLVTSLDAPDIHLCRSLPACARANSLR